MKFLFCPKCHRRVTPPKFLMQANVKSEKGINIECGCGGKVKFKQEEVNG